MTDDKKNDIDVLDDLNEEPDLDNVPSVPVEQIAHAEVIDAEVQKQKNREALRKKLAQKRAQRTGGFAKGNIQDTVGDMMSNGTLDLNSLLQGANLNQLLSNLPKQNKKELANLIKSMNLDKVVNNPDK